MPELQILVGHTGAHINMSTSSDIRRLINFYLQQKLTSWIHIPANRWLGTPARNEIKYKFFAMNKQQNIMYIPVAYVSDLAEYIKKYNPIDVNVKLIPMPAYPLLPLSSPVRTNWIDTELQSRAIPFITDTSKPCRVLELQTGKGKTFCANKAASILDHRTLIISSINLEQWVRVIPTQLHINPSDIYMIRGIGSIEKLFNMTTPPKILVASSKTLLAYVSALFHSEPTMKNTSTSEDDVPISRYQTLKYTYPEMLKVLGIGTKIIDEAHLCFYANTMLDIMSNIPNNIYLSATMFRVETDLNQLFSMIFPDTIRFGGGAYDKYVDIHSYGYRGQIHKSRVVNGHGYNHAKYENALMRRAFLFNQFMEVVFIPLIVEHFMMIKKSNHKAICYFATILMNKKVAAYLNNYFRNVPKFKAVAFVDGMAKSALTDESVTIWLGTPRGLGTGADIANVLSLFNTIGMKADTLTIQQLGRLRKLDGIATRFVDMYDYNIENALKLFYIREKVWNELGNTYMRHTIRN